MILPMKNILWFGLLLVFTGASCSVNPTNIQSQEEDVVTNPVEAIQTVHLEEETASFIFSIDYPSFSNDQQFTDLAKEKILSRKALFEEEISSTQDVLQELGEGFKNGFWVEYAVDSYKETIQTITYTISTYYAGAAHPNTEIMTIVYDLERQRELAFEDIFEQDKDAIFFLSDTIKEDLYKQSGKLALEYGVEPLLAPNDSFIEEGASPFVKNFRNFILTDDSVIFLFPPYQVGPYAEGVKQVTIAYTKIEPYLLKGLKKE